MAWLPPFFLLLSLRAKWLALAILAGALLGEWPARVLAPMARRLHLALAGLHRKLNRANRSMTTLAYRGMVALALVMLPALVLGWLLARPTLAAQWFFALLLVALFGRAFETVRLIALARRAARGQLALESGDRLFADTHGLLRYAILSHGESFAVGVVGIVAWTLIGGPLGCLAYGAVASARLHFGEGMFGWASRHCFALADAIPRLLACTALTVAGVFVPRCHPVAAVTQGKFHGFLATLLGISLGGPIPTPSGVRTLVWQGNGNPKAAAADLTRFLFLRSVASIWLLLALAGPGLFLIFNK